MSLRPSKIAQILQDEIKSLAIKYDLSEKDVRSLFYPAFVMQIIALMDYDKLSKRQVTELLQEMALHYSEGATDGQNKFDNLCKAQAGKINGTTQIH